MFRTFSSVLYIMNLPRVWYLNPIFLALNSLHIYFHSFFQLVLGDLQMSLETCGRPRAKQQTRL